MTTGDLIGPYEITGKLGEGGMGVVYRATDTRLGRMVALKVLSDALSRDPAAGERFAREARAAASAEHTNICTIYDIGQTDEGRRYIAMPLYDGRTVEDMIEEGPLDLDLAIDIASQAAKGLASAHATNVTHRDIKPGNLILTAEGTVKILDFGLARTVDQATITDPGSTVGTAAYMSPEQVQGEALDGRTDIWSLGVVLHEMVAGSRPFKGDYPQAMVYGILNEDPPPLTSLRTGVPVGLDMIVAKCLRKDRDQRYQHVEEIPADLAALRAASGDVPARPAAGPAGTEAAPRPWTRSRMVLAGIPAVVLIAIAVFLLRDPSSSPPDTPVTSRSTIMLASGTRLQVDRPSLALSPDGRMLAYASARNDTSRLYLRPIDSFEVHEFGGTEGAELPFFSPDGQWIAYFTSDALYRVPAAGGRPEFIIDVSLGNTPVASGSWSESGVIVYSTVQGALAMVSDTGEDLGLLAQPSIQDLYVLRFPEMLPDGRHLIAANTSASGEGSMIVAISMEDGSSKILIDPGSHPHVLPSGHIVYADGSDLYAAPFDPERLELTAPPVRVLSGVAHGLFEGYYYDVSRSGTLVYAGEGADMLRRTLTWVDSTGSESPVPIDDSNAYSPKVSPDGRYLAYQRRVPDDMHVYVLDTERQSVAKFTDSDASVQEWWFAWSPDSRSLVFNSTVGSGTIQNVDLFSKTVVGDGPGSRLSEEPLNVAPQHVTADGRYVLYITSNTPEHGGGIDIWAKDLETGEEAPVIATDANEFHPVVSPDGRWLAFASDRSGSWQTYVQPWPEGGSVQQVSSQEMGGGEPAWSMDGQTLYHRSRSGRTLFATPVRSQPVLSGERSLDLGQTRIALEGPYFTCSEWGRSYDVAPDGRLVLVRDMIPGDEMGYVNMVQGWISEVRQLTSRNT